MSRAERLLDLIEEFRRRRRPVSGNELAQAMGVSIRTLYRDIASLRALGADIEGEAGVGYILRSGFLLPPIMFTAEEVDALVLGALWVADKADTPLAEAARKAMARLTAVMPIELVDRVEAKYVVVGQSEHSNQEAIDMAIVRVIEQNGFSVVVLRRQADGRWLMVIDNPFGDHLVKGN